MWFLSVECLLCSATKELSVASKEISPCAVPLLLFGPRLLAICCCVYTRQRTTVARETFPWTSTQTWRDLPLNSFIHACGFALECRSIYKYSLVSFCMDYTDGKHLRFRFFFPCSFCIQLLYHQLTYSMFNKMLSVPNLEPFFTCDYGNMKVTCRQSTTTSSSPINSPLTKGSLSCFRLECKARRPAGFLLTFKSCLSHSQAFCTYWRAQFGAAGKNTDD